MAIGKILILDTYYGQVLNDFYAKNPEVLLLPYNKLRERLMSLRFGTADYYSKNLIKLGWQAEELIVNDSISQARWLKDQGLRKQFVSSALSRLMKVPKFGVVLRSLISRLNINTLYSVVKFQIEVCRPDVVYIQDLGFFNPSFLKYIKSKVKLSVGQIASCKPPHEYLKSYDLILSSLPHYVKEFRELGIPSEYFKLGFEASLLKEFSVNPALNYGAVHIGGYGKTHDERNAVLEEAAKKVEIKFWGYGVNHLKPTSPIVKNYMGSAWGLDRFQIFYNSKITMTKHISAVAADEANNMTLFEATGAGIMLITDSQKNLSDLFVPGKEVETYATGEELADKIKYYLNHEPERAAIAKAGQQRTLKDHTYEVRMRELTEILNKYL